MSKTQIFIEKARAKHGDRYSYGRVVYVRSRDKVLVTCKTHGDFEQFPNDHLQGSGCAKCSIIKRSQEAKDNFIERSRAVHGDRYDYSRTIYVRDKDKVIISCSKHGDFKQIPNSHLSGKGCIKCGFEEMAAKNIQKAKDSFIEKARAEHGDRYDYTNVEYVDARTKVSITCANHGDFEQTPNVHLEGKGCPLCPKRFDQPTNLYLMHNGLGKVKVGYSIDTGKRITQLNSNAPFKAELLETWKLPDTPTALKIEGKIHRKLAKYHAGLSGFDGASEWFNTSPEVAKAAIMTSLA